MFKKTSRILLFLGLCAFTTSVSAVEFRSKPVQCGSRDSLFEVLQEAGEEALVGGVADVIVRRWSKDAGCCYFFC